MMSKNVFAIAFTLILLTGFVSSVDAHPGRTDANGGHTCRTNCESWGLGYGEYHSHNSGGATGGSTHIVQPTQKAVPTAPAVQRNVVRTTVPTRLPTSAPTKNHMSKLTWTKRSCFRSSVLLMVTP